MIDPPLLPRPSAVAVERALAELERTLGPSRVTADADMCARYARDDSPVQPRKPDLVVFAERAADVEHTLRIAAAHAIPVTPRAGGTSRVGGAIPLAGGIVLCTDKLSAIKEVDAKNAVAVVEPGVVLGALHRAVEAEGMFYPPDPSSWESCMIGGNVAANAGGPRALKYGATRDYVLGMTAHLMGGRTLRLGRRTAKGVVGYDLTALFVGSEGTLGVFSEITLKLLPKPPSIATVLATYRDVAAATRGVIAVTSAGILPRCAELLDEHTLHAIRDQELPLRADAGAIVLYELDGVELEPQVERLGTVLAAEAGCLDVHAAHDRGARDALWAARRVLSHATRKLARFKLSEDVVVPRTSMPELLDRIAEHAAATQVRHLTYGHAGDGNLHVNFLWDDEGAERTAIDAALDHLMRTTVALGGTLSGEHGLGITKSQYLPYEQPADLIALQQDLKRVFDPQGLLNPGKIFPLSGHGAC